MDLLMIAGLSIVMGIILTAMGLSFLSQSLKSLEFGEKWGSQTSDNYYQNPLHRLNSKYWHYRPKGSVIVSKKQWKEIETNIGIEISLAKDKGKKIGYKSALVEFMDKIKEKRAQITPASPYAVLDIMSSAPMEDIRLRYQHLKKIYDPRNFVDLDKAFVELAEIRSAQIEKAWKQINFGIGSGI